MKRMVCVLLCAVLLCGLMPCAAADVEEMSLSSCGEGELKIQLTESVEQLIAAAYQNGRFIGCEVKKDCTPGEYSFSLPVSYRYKVFALDSQGRPVCQALEATDESAVLLREETNVPLPTLDDSVASALGAAVSEYAQASLALQKIQEAFASEEAFAKIQGDPALYEQYNEMLSEAMESLQGVMPSLTALDAVTQKQIEEINGALALQSLMRLQTNAFGEGMSWAEELTQQFDALEGNNRIQQLAENMGCDVKTAYSALVAAQEVLYEGYHAEADSYENWENAMIAVKATSKVAFYVCATAATAGAATIAAVPSVLATGAVTAGGGAGILLGAVDVGLELGVDTAKIVLGSSSKSVQHLEDTLQPVTDGLMLFSLCTLSNQAEKVAFLGDLGQRIKGAYDSIRVKSDENGNPTADITSLDNRDPNAAADVAEKKELPSGKDTLDDSGEIPIGIVEEEYGKTKEELTGLLKEEEIIETDEEFSKKVIAYNGKIIPKGGGSDDRRIEEYYDDETGELTEIICYDSNGNQEWRRSYTDGKVNCSYTYRQDEEVEITTKYYQDPDTGIYTTKIAWVEKRRIMDGSEKVLDYLEYNENGTIAEHQYYDTAKNWHDEQYDGNGQISLDTIYYPDRTCRKSYYTTNASGVLPYIETIGHLQEMCEWLNDGALVPNYTCRETWEAEKHENAGNYEYGWKHIIWIPNFSSNFDVIYSEPMPEE